MSSRLRPLTWCLIALLAPAAWLRAAQQPPATVEPPPVRFAKLFSQYRSGDADAAVQVLGTWHEPDVDAAMVALKAADPWSRAAVASLLTEAGMRKGVFGRWAASSPASILNTGWGLDKNFEPFAHQSYTLIKELSGEATHAHDDRLAEFCRRWYAMAISYSIRYGRPSLEGLRAMANHDFRKSATFKMLDGAITENAMGPFVISATQICDEGRFLKEGPEGCVDDPNKTRPLNPPGHYSSAQETLYSFRTALEIDPTLVEARVRLGHADYLLNFRREARAELTRALAEAQAAHSAYLVYVSGLFLGRLEEYEGRLPEAIAAFRLAVGAQPTAHIANVALGEALVRFGDPAGWAEARKMFDDESQEHPKTLDPWFFYRYGQYWRLAQDLRDMRELVRTLP